MMNWPTEIRDYSVAEIVQAEDIQAMEILSIEGETCTVKGNFVSGQRFVCTGIPLDALQKKDPEGR